jgi:hypothetical protein
LNEPIPEVSTDIIENASYNRALSSFYGSFFAKEMITYEIEVLKTGFLENANYDLFWNLKIDFTSYGIIQSITDRLDTVVFHTTVFPKNETVSRSVRNNRGRA